MAVLLVNVDRPVAVVLIVVCLFAVLGAVALVGLGAASSGRSAMAAKQPRRPGGAR